MIVRSHETFPRFGLLCRIHQPVIEFGTIKDPFVLLFEIRFNCLASFNIGILIKRMYFSCRCTVLHSIHRWPSRRHGSHLLAMPHQVACLRILDDLEPFLCNPQVFCSNPIYSGPRFAPTRRRTTIPCVWIRSLVDGIACCGCTPFGSNCNVRGRREHSFAPRKNRALITSIVIHS